MKIIRFFLSFVFTLTLIALVLGGVLYLDYQRFLKTPVITENSPTVYSVKSGDSLSKLMQQFPKQNIHLAANSWFKKIPFTKGKSVGHYYFRFLAKTNKQTNKLKVGDYALRVGMTAPELLDALTAGKTVSYRVRFIEGRTFKDMRKALGNNPNLTHSIENLSDREILEAIGETTFPSPEGLFFPDTYQFSNHGKDIDILRQSRELMKKNLAKAWAERNPEISLKTPYELLILASIIEKETGADSEREKISGVFHRRLAKGMLLQTDPTVIYGMGDKYKGKIYKSDLKRDTPYNTYTRKGLPPTPIAMPGMSSLMAAGQPDGGDALYFVADGKGGHTFSATLAEHNKAVKVYRKSLKSN